MIDLTTNSPEIECKNRHGTIKLNIVERGVYSVRAETSFANLEINVPASLQPKIQTHTSFGKVKSDFPVFDMDTGAANFQNLSSRELRMTLMNEHGDIRVKESVETTPSRVILCCSSWIRVFCLLKSCAQQTHGQIEEYTAKPPQFDASNNGP
jgi:hypothetical protein